MNSLFLASFLAGELCRPAPHTSLELPGDTTCWRGGCIDVMSPAQGKTTAGACTEEAIPDEVLRGLFAATDTVPKGKVATSAEVAAAATALGLPSQQKDVIKVQRGPAKGSLPPLSVALPGATGAALLSADPLPFVTIVHFDGDKHADVVVGALSMKASGSIVGRATVLLGPFEPRLGQPKRVGQLSGNGADKFGMPEELMFAGSTDDDTQDARASRVERAAIEHPLAMVTLRR